MKRVIIFLNLILILFLIILLNRVKLDVGVHLDDSFLGVSSDHLFGTDNLGRDVFSLIVVGGKRTLEVLVITTLIAFIFGTSLGLVSGYFENGFSKGIKLMADLFMIVPSLVSAMIITAIFGITPLSAGLALGIFGIGSYLNQTENLTKREKHMEYIKASQLFEVPVVIILFKRIFPNISKELYVNLGNTAVATIISYSSLTFIGLGSDFSQPDWGTMLYEYRIYMISHPFLIIIPTLCIFWLSLSLNIIFENIER